jgi:histone H1/5
MNKSVMNAIEVLSANFNFSVDDAVSILTTNNKKSRSKAKDVQPKKEVEDLFAQLVNDSDDEVSRGKTYEFDLKPVPETVIITTNTFEASDVKKPAKKEKKTVDPEKEKAVEELAVKKALKELEKEKAKEAKMLKELEKQKEKEAKEAKKKASEDKEEMKKQKLLNKDVAALEKKAAAEAAIEAKKVAKEQEKLAAIEAKKAAKEQEKLAAIEAKKAAKEQEKLAAIEAKKAAKEQEKLALKASKEQEKKEKKPVNKKSTKPESEETTTQVDEAPVKVSVKRIKIGEHEYLKSESNILYNPETKEEVGLYDAESNSIKPLPDDDEEELEEDNYDM